MAQGKKTTTAPEVGDLVTSKNADTYGFNSLEDRTNAFRYDAGEPMGNILAVGTYKDETLYQTTRGWLFDWSVTTKANPEYNYAGTSGGGSWSDSLNKLLDLAKGVLLPSKKTNTGTGTQIGTKGEDDDETDPKDETKKSNTVWYVVGGVSVVGVVLAILFWPKKNKAVPAPNANQPVVIG
jgi:hypothetical protein